MAGEAAGEPRREAIPRFELLEITPEERHRRRAAFGAGSVAQIMVVALVLWFLTATPFEEPKITSRPWVARITLQPPPQASAPPHRPRMVRIPFPPPLKQQAELPKANPKPVSRPQAPPLMAELQPSSAPKLPTPSVVPPRIAAVKPTPLRKELQARVGVFDGSPAVATTKLPRARVQTGGFGDPQGLPGEAEGGSRGNVPHLGAFDRPEGPGSGNGSGGEHGARALVASAGFGNGIDAAPGLGRGADEGATHPAGFADARSLTQAVPHSKPQAAVATFQPVVIEAKPDPVYTEEARRLHIQGEVVLRVVFKASGQLQVLGVEHGLGHGLDEAAVRAAQHMRFMPARRDGKPVDTPATLHILFQLAE